MSQGVVKKVVADRGFGFISGESGDVFFHHSVVEENGFDNLQEGQTVEYEVDDDGGGRRGKGPRASMVKPL